MIEIDPKKYERQQLGQNKWKSAKDLGLSHKNGWGTLEWFMGVGKTFATCDIFNKMLQRNDAYNFIVTVPGTENELQWRTAIKEFIPIRYQQNVQVYSATKLMLLFDEGKYLKCTLFVIDELHEYYTDDRLRVINPNYVQTTFCLGLTATYEDIKNRHKALMDVLPVIDKIDEFEAVREGYVSKFIEYNLSVNLTDAESQKYDYYTNSIGTNGGKFGKWNQIETANKLLTDTSFVFALATQYGWTKTMDLSVQANADIYNNYSPAKLIGYAKAYMNAVRDRKDLLYSATNKLIKAREIAIKFENLKTIFFSQSTNFADALCSTINNYYRDNNIVTDTIPCVVYHSQLQTLIYTDSSGKQKKKGKVVLKREAIENIRTGRARRISTASSLDKGFDVQDIKLGVTTSGTQNPTQASQRKGRSIRIDFYEKDNTVLIINLYVPNTVDEYWLKKRQSKGKNTVYWIKDVDKITYTPKNNNWLEGNTI